MSRIQVCASLTPEEHADSMSRWGADWSALIKDGRMFRLKNEALFDDLKALKDNNALLMKIIEKRAPDVAKEMNLVKMLRDEEKKRGVR